MRKLRPHVAGAAVALLAVGVAPAVDAAEPKRITRPMLATRGDIDPTRTYSAPALAVDPENKLRVVASFVEMRSRRCGIMRSVDGGQTWKKLDASPSLPSYPFCIVTNSSVFHAPLAFGRDGTLYALLAGWDTQDGGLRLGNTSVLLGRSTDLGDTWKTTIVHNARGRQGEQLEQNRPMTGLVVDTKSGSEDIVYAAWRVSFPGATAPNALPSLPRMAVSTNGGRTFGPPIALVGDAFAPEAVRAEALKTTTTTTPPPTTTTTAAPAPTQGAPAATPTTAAPTTTTTVPPGSRAANVNQPANFGGANPAIAVDDRGTVYAVWSTTTANFPSNRPAATAMYFTKSTDRGKTLQVAQIAPFDRRNGGSFNGPRLAWSPKGGPNGTLHLVHEGMNQPAIDNEKDIFYRRSTDGGRTWTAPVVLNDDDPKLLYGQYIPNIAVAPNGRVDVTWWDTRHDPGIRANDVYYTSSSDNGRTWSKNVRITDRSIDRKLGVWGNNFDMSSPPSLASTDEFALVGWDDTRNATVVDTSGPGSGTQDIYISAVQYRALGGGSSAARYALAAVLGLLAVSIVLLLIAAASSRGRLTGPPPAERIPDREPAEVR